MDLPKCPKRKGGRSTGAQLALNWRSIGVLRRRGAAGSETNRSFYRKLIVVADGAIQFLGLF